VDTVAFKASIAQAEGDLPHASAILGSIHPTADHTGALETQIYQAILERRPEQMISRLKEILVRPDPAMGYFNGELRFWLGWAQQVGRDHAGAQESWRQAQNELGRFFQEPPENYNLMHDLALVDMGLGNKAAALSMVERAIATNRIEKDVVDGPASIEILARSRRRLESLIALSPPYRNCSRYRMKARYLWATRRLLLPCSDSIQCSNCCEMIRASKNSSSRLR
jgi:hypothetical protein